MKMKFRNHQIKAFRFVGSLLLSSLIQATFLMGIAPAESENSLKPTREKAINIEQEAKRITVRLSRKEQVLGSNGDAVLGSGVIIQKREAKGKYGYLVLTNQHVVKDEKEVLVETPDGKVYPAYPHNDINKNLGDLDLRVLYFWSPSGEYQKATLGNSSTLLKLGEVFRSTNNPKVYIAGFPCQKNLETNVCESYNFEVINGNGFLLDKPLPKGRQVGYIANVIEGSSGGAVLNEKAELIAINSLGQYSNAPDYTNEGNYNQELMAYFSWGIPIDEYQKKVGNTPNIPPPKDDPPPPNHVDDFEIKNFLNSRFNQMKLYVVIIAVIAFIITLIIMLLIRIKILEQIKREHDKLTQRLNKVQQETEEIPKINKEIKKLKAQLLQFETKIIRIPEISQDLQNIKSHMNQIEQKISNVYESREKLFRLTTNRKSLRSRRQIERRRNYRHLSQNPKTDTLQDKPYNPYPQSKNTNPINQQKK